MAIAVVPTVEHVREIINIDVDDNIVLAAISSSVATVSASLGNDSVPSALIFEIEKWLAAHFLFVSTAEGITVEEGIGEAYYKKDASVVVSTDSNSSNRFTSTLYGRTAVDLDPTGKLKGGQTVKKQRLCAI